MLWFGNVLAPPKPLERQVSHDWVMVGQGASIPVCEQGPRPDARYSGGGINRFSLGEDPEIPRGEPVEPQLERHSARSDAPLDPPFHEARKPLRVIEPRDYAAAGGEAIVRRIDFKARSAKLCNRGLPSFRMAQAALQFRAVAQDHHCVPDRIYPAPARERVSIQIAAHDRGRLRLLIG